MSLYDDVVTDISSIASSEAQNDTASTWSSSSTSGFKLMQMQVEAVKKRQSLNKTKPAFNQKVTNIAPVIDLSDKRGKPQIQLKKDTVPSIDTPTLSLIAQSQPSSFVKIDKIEEAASIYSSLIEEYDPMQPNDYEKILEDSTEKSTRLDKENSISSGRKKEGRNTQSKNNVSRSRSRDLSRRNKNKRISNHRSRSRSRSRGSRDDRKSKRRGRKDSSSEASDDHESKRKNDEARNSIKSSSRRQEDNSKRTNNAFAPPPSLLESTSTETEINKMVEVSLPTKSLFGSLKAEKMMAKMGYKEGDGLGRNKQGMSIALQVEKTGKRIGRIIHEKDGLDLEMPPSVVAPVSNAPVVGIPADVMKNMSKVILLTNMVAPGDVDEDLEQETKEECAKYGEVNKCVIYELPDRSLDEAVRIFLEFKTLPSAIKALTDLNGRFFGGRSVRATFYDFDKFKNLQLSD